MLEGDARATAEWMRHWDVICLSTLTIATAVSGTAAIIAINSAIPRALTSGYLTTMTIAWGVLGTLALLLYLATTMIAGIAIHLLPDHRNPNVSVKQIAVTVAYGLFTLEVFTLAIMLIINLTVTVPEP